MHNYDDAVKNANTDCSCTQRLDLGRRRQKPIQQPAMPGFKNTIVLIFFMILREFSKSNHKLLKSKLTLSKCLQVESLSQKDFVLKSTSVNMFHE